jgi:hypothetical protein
LAKTKGSNPPETEFAYKDAGGILHYLGEFIRMMLSGGFPSPTELQRFQRKAFKDCAALWNSLPEECPDPLPEDPVTAKESVWDAKVEFGVPCTYYDLFMRCCMQYAKWHAGAMPDGDCFPCARVCNCLEISVGYTTQGMQVNEEQTLWVAGAAPGCIYDWEITSGAGELSAASGNSVIYTAPASNPNCDANAAIALSVGGVVCDTLLIAINAWAYGGIAYYMKLCVAESFCYHHVEWGCADVDAHNFDCQGNDLGYRSGCPYSGCTGPDCCCYEDSGCIVYQDDYCKGQFGSMTCLEAAKLPGCADPGSLNEGMDVRDIWLKSFGCCPAALL